MGNTATFSFQGKTGTVDLELYPDWGALYAELARQGVIPVGAPDSRENLAGLGLNCVQGELISLCTDLEGPNYGIRLDLGLFRVLLKRSQDNIIHQNKDQIMPPLCPLTHSQMHLLCPSGTRLTFSTLDLIELVGQISTEHSVDELLSQRVSYLRLLDLAGRDHKIHPQDLEDMQAWKAAMDSDEAPSGFSLVPLVPEDLLAMKIARLQQDVRAMGEEIRVLRTMVNEAQRLMQGGANS